jgi:hypothetical protein
MSSKIYLNGTFTYKQVCEKLHVEPKRGRAQQTHIQELHKTHNFEERNLNATRKVYVFNDGDKNNKTTTGYEDFNLAITSGYIRYLVYRTLLEEHNDILDLSLEDIRKKLNICNDNYEFSLYNTDKTSVIKEAVHLPQMTRELDRYIKQQITSALKLLQDRYGVLYFTEVFKYQTEDKVDDTSKWEYMTDDQIHKYIKIKQEVLRSYTHTTDDDLVAMYDLPQQKVSQYYTQCRNIFNISEHLHTSQIRKVFHIVNVKEYSDKVCKSQIEKYNKKLLSEYQKHGAYMMKQYVNKSKAMDKYSIRDKRTAKNMFGENPHRDFQQEYIDNVTTNQ